MKKENSKDDKKAAPASKPGAAKTTGSGASATAAKGKAGDAKDAKKAAPGSAKGGAAKSSK